MKVFISWSGKFSKECAEILRDWIKCTLQASEPWISSKDIDKGSLWFNEISDQLKDTKVGIVCLTQDNKDKPWILFESGALAKGLSATRVCTFLINLKPSDLDSPLAQFNHTIPDKEGMKGLLTTINKELGEKKLEDRILDQVFDTYWDSFEIKFNEVVKSEPKNVVEAAPRSNDDILEEILYTTRTMDRKIRALERDNAKHIRHSIYGGRVPARKVEALIKSMVDSGLNPSQIMEELKDTAPSEFVSRRAGEIWEEKALLDELSGECA